MNSTMTSPRAFLAGSSLAGAQGFGIAFAAMGMVLRVLTLNVTDPNLNLALGTILYGAAGALGAAYLASATRWRAYTMLFALGGILGCGGGYIVTTLALTSRIHPEITLRVIIEGVSILQHVIIGALLGLFLGIAIWKPRTLAFLIIGGALGFGIGFLMQVSLNDLLSAPLADFIARITESDAVNLIAASLLWGLGSALCGMLGGGAIGYALDL